ncbi:hypothetical protein [Geothrix sp. 21YS21S-4]|uniref:hypothetical protein n=1 Tax=Geothrix sp. 21YS21S-4 TaxID=3068889 RepID=UPI0027BAEEF6|nr:hypothetical protein [Geothrix sp. 21YS21S-4]
MVRPSMILATMALSVGLLTGCRGVPSRPAALPAEARWAGEGKDGVFFKAGSHEGTLWQLEVWDRKGNRLGSGAFRLKGFAKAEIVPEEVLGWRNGALQLKDGTWLVPERP